jgi:hypothetical protein
LGELDERVAAPQKMVGTEICIRKPSVPVFLVAVDLVDLRRQIASLLRLRPSSGLRSFSPRPQGRLKTYMVGRLLANALPWRCFPGVVPPPTEIHPYPPRRPKTHHIHVPPVDMRVSEEYLTP